MKRELLFLPQVVFFSYFCSRYKEKEKLIDFFKTRYMKYLHRLFAFSLCAILTVGYLAIPSVQGQNTIRTMNWDGQTRRYLCIEPTNMNTNEAMPMMLFLHGLHDSLDHYIDEPMVQHMADRYGWLVVMPEAMPYVASLGGFTLDMGNTWNANMTITVMNTTMTVNGEVDDTGFLMALMDTLKGSYSIEEDSIFLSGMSMGGFMTHRMAIEHGDQFTACAAVSGLITLPYANSEPLCDVRMMHIHGTNDAIVSDQGYFNILTALGNIQVGMSAEQTVNYWVEHNGCTPNPTIDTLDDRRDDGMRFVRHTYSNSESNAEVEFLQVINGQHEWYADEQIYDVNYLTEIHDFFVGNHTTYNAIEKPSETRVVCYPNPASEQLTVVCNTRTNLSIYNMAGRKVGMYRMEGGSNKVNIGHLPSGIYMGQCDNGATMKIVKQ